MKIYYTIDEVLSDRRKGTKLSEVFENILYSPYVLEQLETPFNIIRDLYSGDYLDMSTEAWGWLPVELQIKYATAYQVWFAHYSGHPSIEGMFEFVPEVEVQMMLIPPGKFRMGSPEDEPNRDPDEEQKLVHIEKPFWCKKFEVTQAEWIRVMGTNPFPRDCESPWRPATNVNWVECQEFCEMTGVNLLSDEQWEYACRAGTTTVYNFGNDGEHIQKYAFAEQSYHSCPEMVDQSKKNAWGLFDMHGNVWEWTSGIFVGDIPDMRINRGGCWYSTASRCRSANRRGGEVSRRYDNIGFRTAKKV